MIFTNRIISVSNGKSKINEPIVAYRGDYELEVRFTILNSTFNFIETENAAFGQLAVLTPYGGNIFSSITECNEGAVSFLLSRDMLDQIEEVGKYSFQIRLFDQDQQARVTIPPVEYGIEVREPIASEDHDNTVNNAIVGYSIAKVVNPNSEVVGDTFDVNGQYNKTNWKTGDRISQGKLNKIEDALDKINKNEKNDTETLNKRVTTNYNVLNSSKADKNQVFTMDNMGTDIKLAMTGGSVPVVGINAVNTENIVDRSINAVKIWNQFLYTPLFYEGNVVPDFTFNDVEKTLTLTLPPTCYLMVGFMYKKMGEYSATKTVTIPYPSNISGVTVLCWTESTSDFELINYMDYTNLNSLSDKQKYLIATIGIIGKTVTMPGRYTINGKAHMTDDTIKTNHIQNNAVTMKKLHPQVQPARIFGNGVINCVFMTNKLRMYMPKNSYIVLNEWYKDITPNDEQYLDIPYPDNGVDGIIYLLYSKSENKFKLVRFLTINSFVNNTDILFVGLVGIGIKESERYVHMNADYVVNGGLPGKEFHLTFTEPITYDHSTGKIKIPQFFVQRSDMQFKSIKPEFCGIASTHFEYSLPNAYNIKMICLDYERVINWTNDVSDTNKNPLLVCDTASMPPRSSLQNNLCVIATMIYDKLTTIYPYKEIGGVNGLEWGTFNSKQPIDFNWTKGEITYGFGVIQYKNNFLRPAVNNWSGNTIKISNTDDGVQWLLYNMDDNTFKTYHYTGNPSIDWNKRWLIIATFWIGGKVQTLSNYTINGKPYGISQNSFIANNGRLLLPNKMFLVKGEDLPIYMTSIIPVSNELSNISPAIRYKEGNNRRMDTFADGYDLVSDKVKSGFRIGYTQNLDAKLYFKDISVSYCDPTLVSNKLPKILHIGDSITNRYVALRNEVYLKQWGITPTYVGTLSNLGNRRGEGREGWEYSNFVGLSSIWSNDYSVIVPDASSTTTNLNLNPFIKVATDEDKANYPDWCFTYNKVVRETSYTDAEDKSQTFYIFDIENYLSAHSVDTPDIITIALSTNDINRRNDYLEACLFSMNVMISRIREQLPNVKIGIIPSPAWGHGNSNFTSRTAGWIEECIKDVTNRNDNKVFIVPIWCHMNRAWGFPTNGSDISDTIHPGVEGQEQYGKAMAMFIANMCL